MATTKERVLEAEKFNEISLEKKKFKRKKNKLGITSELFLL